VSERGQLAPHVVSAGAGLHPNQTSWKIAEPLLELTTRQLLPEDNPTAGIHADQVEGGLPKVDSKHGNRVAMGLISHGVLRPRDLELDNPPRSTAGPYH
jgi:hypothetical protein